ncbi:unnamed protein product [Ectocarpus sp. CCAP 1310/34]|nr:unnamed protein product [Ectocarpus sp. CCAP 1310/34]
MFSVTSSISSSTSCLKTSSSPSSTLSQVRIALSTSSSVRPEALSTNKLSVNTRGLDLASSRSLALSGMDTFSTISHRQVVQGGRPRVFSVQPQNACMGRPHG